jgi:transcription elongation factor/antiterminator RfaH
MELGAASLMSPDKATKWKLATPFKWFDQASSQDFDSGMSNNDAASVAGARDPRGDLKLRGREQWYVAQTLHHREKVAERHLREQCFRSFFPQFRRTVRHARTLREVVTPVFPGYIFVIFDTERDRWHSINGTVGVARLLTTLKRPVPVPADIVQALIGAMDVSGCVVLGANLRVGEVVRVVAGPFVGGLGVLERLDGKGRVRVLLNIMGGQTPLMIDRADLAAA